mgnify:CR=1 FL=1
MTPLFNYLNMYSATLKMILNYDIHKNQNSQKFPIVFIVSRAINAIAAAAKI